MQEGLPTDTHSHTVSKHSNKDDKEQKEGSAELLKGDFRVSIKEVHINFPRIAFEDDKS